MRLPDMATGLKMFGALAGVAALGASGMAASVSAKIDHHMAQTDSVLVELRAIHHVESQLLCLQLGLEERVACLLK